MMRLAALLALFSAPAFAQDCLDRDPTAGRLAAQYGEARSFAGLAISGEVVEVFVSADGGSWTVLVTGQDGCTRMVAAGPRFLTFDRPPEGEPL